MVTEVVTMKMISSIRNKSISGVMLMSAKTAPPPPSLPPPCGPLMAMRLPPLEGGIDQTLGVDAQDGVDVFNLDREIVVEDNGDNCDRESQGGGDERLGDARGDDRETAGAHDSHRLEGDQDADDSPEQSDERRRRARSREHPDVTLQLEGLLVAALVIVVHELLAIHGLRGRDDRMVHAL